MPSFIPSALHGALRKCMARFFWLIETNPRELKLDDGIWRNAHFLVLNCVSCWYPQHSSDKTELVIRSPIMIHSAWPHFEALDSYWQIRISAIDCDYIHTDKKNVFLWKNVTVAANLPNYRPRSEQTANEIYREGHSFLRTYQALSFISIRQSRLTFLIKPKYHVAQLVCGGWSYFEIIGIWEWFWNAGIPVQIDCWISIPSFKWILIQPSEAMIHILRDVRRFRALCGAAGHSGRPTHAWRILFF